MGYYPINIPRLLIALPDELDRLFKAYLTRLRGRLCDTRLLLLLLAVFESRTHKGVSDKTLSRHRKPSHQV